MKRSTLVLTGLLFTAPAFGADLANSINGYFGCKISQMTSVEKVLAPGSVIMGKETCAYKPSELEMKRRLGTGNFSATFTSASIGQDAMTLLGLPAAKANLVKSVGFRMADSEFWTVGDSGDQLEKLEKVKADGCALTKAKKPRIVDQILLSKITLTVTFKEGVSAETILALLKSMKPKANFKGDATLSGSSFVLELNTSDSVAICQETRSVADQLKYLK